MKKRKACLTILSLLLVLFFVSPVSAATGPEVSARAAVLVSADTGETLFSKNESEKLSMASTTKIMTALLTLEAASRDNKTVSVTEDMVRVEGSSMGLLPGYQLRLRDLAAGMLIASGNDAANAAAVAVGGSADRFLTLMNRRAAELGMNHTHFETPSGLDSEGHYSTAADMALLGMAAMRNSDFFSIVSQKQVRIALLEPEQVLCLSNHNRLLGMYEGCVGIKTGFTKKSGRCLVSAAQRNGIRLVAVTLNAPDDWNDHVRLFDYGFSRMTSYPMDDSALVLQEAVAGGRADMVFLSGGKTASAVIAAGREKDVVRTVNLPRFVYAPVKRGQLVGTITYRLDGRLLGETAVTAGGDVEASPAPKPQGFLENLLGKIKKIWNIG